MPCYCSPSVCTAGRRAAGYFPLTSQQSPQGGCAPMELSAPTWYAQQLDGWGHADTKRSVPKGFFSISGGCASASYCPVTYSYSARNPQPTSSSVRAHERRLSPSPAGSFPRDLACPGGAVRLTSRNIRAICSCQHANVRSQAVLPAKCCQALPRARMEDKDARRA